MALGRGLVTGQKNGLSDETAGCGAEATRVLGAKTYSGAVNTALEEVIRLRKIQGIARFFGSGIWEGDLADMREDRTRRARSPR